MPTGSVLHGHDELRRGANWLLFVGILLILLGMAALSFPWFTTVTTLLFYGWTLLIGSVLHAITLFHARRWEGFALHLLSAVLAFVVGLFIVMHPVEGAVGLTLLIAIFLMVGGLFRAVTSLFLQYPNWVWSVVSGLIALLLGTAVWRGWPYDSLWFIGMCVGVDFIVQGWSWVMFALALRARTA